MAKNTDLVPVFRKLSWYNFAYFGAFALFTIIFDSGNVLTREAIYQRWMMAAVLLVVFTFFWIASRKASSYRQMFRVLLLCVAVELMLAGFMTYWERGMASTSTILYMVPILTMAFARSRTYTIATALIASAIYTAAATKYFYDFFNEGYRVQLYGEIFFYCAVFIVCGGILAALVHATTSKK
jgi:hypothetical protein